MEGEEGGVAFSVVVPVAVGTRWEGVVAVGDVFR